MMSRATGRALSEGEHIKQSIGDILTTPLGSRIARRSYGSMLPDLIDHPGNPANRLRLMSATVMALLRWEPRIALNTVTVQVGLDGAVELEITGTRRNGQRAGQPFTVTQALQ